MKLITPEEILHSNKRLKYFGGIYIVKFFMWLIKLTKLNNFYSRHTEKNAIDFLNQSINSLGFTYEVSKEDFERIPKEGPFILISNHPYGGLEAVITLKILIGIRPDFKYLANFLLMRIKPLKDYFLPVNPFESQKDLQSSYTGIRNAFKHLRNDCALAIFPAGEVSSYKFKKGTSTDREWQEPILKFIKAAKVPVLPVYYSGSNSYIFHLLGLIHPILRTIKLPSELFNKKGKTFGIRFGCPISVEEQNQYEDIKEYGKLLRTKTYSLGSSLEDINLWHFTLDKNKEIIIDPVDINKIEADISEIENEHLLFKYKDHSVYCSPAKKIPNVVREIGRLREKTYREIGEGTNTSLDIDKYDDYYTHLFIWDHTNKKIVGAYRIGKGKDIMSQYGVKGFYIESLFKIDPEFHPKLNESLELGRSFIIKEYQKKPISLFLLWKGLFYFVLKNPDYRYLTGPVSISDQFSDLSKYLSVAFLVNNHMDPDYSKLIKSRNNYIPQKHPLVDMDFFCKIAGKDINKLEKFIRDIEPKFRLPVLLKKYINLNSRILGFNIDPKFSDCLDILMILDLFKMPEKTIISLSKELDDPDILTRFNITKTTE